MSDEFLGRFGQLHGEKPRRIEEPLEMVTRPEDEKLSLLFVPVAAQTRETPGAVVQGVREHAQTGLSIRNDSTLEKGVFGKVHRRTSSPKWTDKASNCPAPCQYSLESDSNSISNSLELD